MDLATIIGFVLTIVLIVIAMGSYLTAFVDIPSLLIVLGGTIGTLLIWHPMGDDCGYGQSSQKSPICRPT